MIYEYDTGAKIDQFWVLRTIYLLSMIDDIWWLKVDGYEIEPF